ncbi:tRNA (adenosine(37)-N6)-threonylcarbamoyltransferase complex ATPase subunit type 1 TsaE [Campylobacter pinnipediorum]|uniref:tRNA (adenosine(37)-N6)-threonylcarbamoyltransferase complex ATPase subunit type 1 TsaE n=1 Tax=Campylobacter pinnipediorum TaxID=1965231 RepID=UPI00084DB6FF|nr:tRNA (adenosine(37)-N6)-threonylcarbamoyltransferase complex ATPase subunit type 1 TsaE [Campylobacter pinnipediorum]AQW81204.1 N6-L-threonylcarbamoyladenine synthase, TsaE subunit [Campylobacter pinnipediorum subsp. pinnipediorum]AQW82821.1 N6-L-threonylcarbamoyladenine synthase, TsaE subunit [Campylobacter pinnipediorum subsp. pinnipediorum]AQW84508.1 N6-L-threonylcarbamoyladenine synthase, TsaE subunit [Campylobacter pinnipediorum subsp. pinnipediorum]
MSKKFILCLNDINSLMDTLPKSGIILLQGTLASGKTTLVKSIVKFHGIDEEVTSPTFSIMQSYKSENITIYHYDIYQNGVNGLLNNGLFENLFEDGLHLVEWGDENLENLLKNYEMQYIKIVINLKDDLREYEVFGA